MAKSANKQRVFKVFTVEDVHAILTRVVAAERGLPVERVDKSHVAWCYEAGKRNFSQARIELELL